MKKFFNLNENKKSIFYYTDSDIANIDCNMEPNINCNFTNESKEIGLCWLHCCQCWQHSWIYLFHAFWGDPCDEITNRRGDFICKWIKPHIDGSVFIYVVFIFLEIGFSNYFVPSLHFGKGSFVWCNIHYFNLLYWFSINSSTIASGFIDGLFFLETTINISYTSLLILIVFIGLVR